MYNADFTIDRLMSQLSMLPDFVRTANEERHSLPPIKEVTSVNTIVDLMNENQYAKRFLSEVDRLIKLYLTVPMTSATAERTFSTLRRLKNFLRSTMTQTRLNNIIMLHTHKDRTDNLDLDVIATEFISANDRRQSFFGNNQY